MAEEEQQSPEEKLPLNREELKRVASLLLSRFDVYKKNRRGAEQQWLKNLRQVLGEYDPEFLKSLSAQQSRAYPKITRIKCVSMVSRLMSLLFPMSEKNWSLSPSPSPSLSEGTLQKAVVAWQQDHPDAPLTEAAVRQAVAKYSAKAAQQMEQEIEDQLQDVSDYGMADYTQLARKVIESAVKYSMGVIKGPMTLEDARATYTVQNGDIVVGTETAYRPYYQYVSIWDYYPDMSAKSFAQMEGQFQRHVMSRYQLSTLAKRDDFYGDIIREYIRENPAGNYTELTHEVDLRTLGENNMEAKEPGSSKFELIEYWGQMSGADLRSAGVEVAEADLDDEYAATVWMLDDVVVKAARNPFPFGTKMYHQFIFEEDDVNLVGSGLPPIVRDSQMGVANSSRMMLDNAAAVCGPNVEVDITRMVDGQDLTSINPFKVWMTEASNNNSNPAVRSVVFESHVPALSNVIEQFRTFADAETFVGPMTGGDMSQVPGEALRTTGGMSMAMTSAALPFRDIVRNFDTFTVSVIHSLVAWNKIFNPKEELEGDLRPVAKGATSLMAKELRAAAMDNLANTLTDDERDWIDTKHLVRQRLMSRDLPLNELLLTDEAAEIKRNERTAAAQETSALQNELIKTQIAAAKTDTLKASSQAQRNLDVGDAQTARLILDALVKGVNPAEIMKYVQPPTQQTSDQPVQPQGLPGPGPAGPLP